MLPEILWHAAKETVVSMGIDVEEAVAKLLERARDAAAAGSDAAPATANAIEAPGALAAAGGGGDVPAVTRSAVESGSTGAAAAAADACPDIEYRPVEVTVEPGCTGFIETAQKWAEAAIAQARSFGLSDEEVRDIFPEGSIPDRLVEAELDGTGNKEATQIAVEQGLFAPGAEKDSFNMYASSKLELTADGELRIVDPNGKTAYTLSDCTGNKAAYAGSRMLATHPCGEVVSYPPPAVPMPEVKAPAEVAPPPPVVEITPEPVPPPAPAPEAVVAATVPRVWWQTGVEIKWCEECDVPGKVVEYAARTDLVLIDVDTAGDVDAQIQDAIRSLPDTYQSNIPPDERFVSVRILDEEGRQAVKCVNIKTGHEWLLDGDADTPGIQRIRSKDGLSLYISGAHDFNGNDSVYHPHMPTGIELVDTDGDGRPDAMREIVLSLPESQDRQVNVVGTSVLRTDVSVPGEAHDEWQAMLKKELPEEFAGMKTSEQIKLLKEEYGLSGKEARRLAAWIEKYASGYADMRHPDGSMKTLEVFLRDAAETAARRGELGATAVPRS